MSQHPSPITMHKKRPHNNSVFVMMFTDIVLAMILVMFYTFSPGKHNSNAQVTYTDVTTEHAKDSIDVDERKLNTTVVYVMQEGFRLSGKEYKDIKALLKMLKEKGISRVVVVPTEKQEQQLFWALRNGSFDLAIGYVKNK